MILRALRKLSMAERKMDSTPPSGKTVKDWDVKEDKKYEINRYLGNPSKFFFKQIEEAFLKKGIK